MQTAAAIVPPDHALPDDAYAILRSRLQAIGCFQRQPGYYLRKTAISAAALGGVVALAVLADSTLVVLLSAIALGIMSTQFGLIAHDVAHKQVFRGRRAIAGASLILGNLLLGMSYTWWREKHDRHHATPNHVTRDPDCDISLLVLAPGQRSQRPRIVQAVVRWQFLYYWFLIPFQATGMRIHSTNRITKIRSSLAFFEAAGLLGHVALYGLVIAFIGPWWVALLFVVLHQATFGTYNSLVFAPNHKGMLSITDDSRLDFLLEQIVTSRNVKGSPLTDFVYGGLNYQIEHHLFTNMPRNQLSKAQPIVEAFCHEHGIPYVEEGFFAATGSVFSFLGDVPNAPPIDAPARAAT